METFPSIGLGTWKLRPEHSYMAVTTAVRMGYRHIDCASTYGNEEEIGRALRKLLAEGTVSREELWITSKLPNTAHDPDAVLPAVEKSLGDLQLKYLDTCLMHWPVALKPGVWIPRKADHFHSLEEMPLDRTWAAMEKLVGRGKVRCLGVCNFSIRKLNELFGTAYLPPHFNQVESHPYLQQSAMLEFCQKNGIRMVAYAPLGSGDRPKPLVRRGEPVLLEDTVICEVAMNHQVPPSAVLLAWALQRGTAVIPKASNPQHMKANLIAAYLQLSDEEMHRITGLERHYRYIDGSFWVLPNGPYTLSNLWDE